MNLEQWHIDPDAEAVPGYSPDMLEWPRRGYRLVRLRRVIDGDYYLYTETEIPIETPKSRELEVALEMLE